MISIKMSLCQLLRHNVLPKSFAQIRFSSLLANPKQEEIQIPVPWGHIAGSLLSYYSHENKEMLMTPISTRETMGQSEWSSSALYSRMVRQLMLL